MRVTEYHAIHQRTGWELLLEENESKQTDRLDLTQLAPEFQKYSPEELMVTESWMISRSNL
jgi:hypothetical protein